MDYCSSCRRHLNGALVCPGCGAYAPDIAPITAQGRSVPAPVGATPFWPRPAEAPGLGPDPYDTLEHAQGAEGVEGAVPVTEGRAARRRQRARWKKNQRRAVVATAVALVGGGLTVASMDRGSGHRPEASAAPDLSSMGTDEQSADQSAEPPATHPGGKHRKPQTTPAKNTAAGAPQQRSTETLQTASARTQPYSAPHTTSKRAAQPQPSATPSAGTGATSTGSGSTTATQSPSAKPTDDTTTSGTSQSGSSQSGSSQSGTSPSSTAPGATSPSGICVLGLLCLS